MPPRVPRIECRCETCGATFYTFPRVIAQGGGRTCSRICHLKTVWRTEHGHTVNNRRSPTYSSWQAMIRRCENPKDIRYDRYGARGIGVCDRWHTFENFLADMGERPPGRTLDRIDGNRGYEPGNCRWATPAQQTANREATNLVEFRGRSQTIPAWAMELGIAERTLRGRLEQGWTVEAAFTKPVRRRNPARPVGFSAELPRTRGRSP